MDKTLKPASSRTSINETTHRSRRNFDDRFKAMVVLEALREDRTMNELASKYDVHPNQISLWKNEFVKNADSVFSAPRQLTKEIEQLNAEIENLHRVIGEKDMDIDFLKKTAKKLGVL
jgi:transposase